MGGEPHTTQMLAARKIYLPRKKNTERDRRKKTSLTRMFAQGGFVRVTSSQADRLPEAIAGLEDVARRLLPA